MGHEGTGNVAGFGFRFPTKHTANGRRVVARKRVSLKGTGTGREHGRTEARSGRCARAIRHPQLAPESLIVGPVEVFSGGAVWCETEFGFAVRATEKAGE